ncbi:MAG: sensor histidine kinase [Eubacteriales bacterium]
MKGRQSTGLKILAAVFAVLFLLAAAGLALTCVAAAGSEFYTSTYEYLENSMLRAMVLRQLLDVYHAYSRGDDPAALYGQTNLLFRLRNADGVIVAQSQNGSLSPDAAPPAETADTEVEFMPQLTPTVEADDGALPDGEEDGAQTWYTREFFFYDGTDTQTVFSADGAVNRELPVTDRYSLAIGLLRTVYSLRYALPFLAAGCAILYIVLLAWLMCAAGYHRGSEEPRRGWPEYIPFDVLVVIYICAAALESELFYLSGTEALVCLSIAAAADAILLTLFMMTLAVRVKTRTLLKTTLVWYAALFCWRIVCALWRCISRIFSFIGGSLAMAFRGIPLVWKTALFVGANLLLEMFVGLLCAPDFSFLFMFILCKDAVLGVAILFTAVVMRRLQTGGERLAAGALDTKIDTRYMYGDFREFAENMNRLGDGMSAAVEERMKSERFRAELITNVSHDIKTPLTSIVNYVDLIRKENVETEPLRGYVEVLARQAARLKKLTEDLIEASKAATGSIAVHLETCDATVLLEQACGEYEERLRAAALELIVRRPEENVRITADGRLLWRVLDNLMNNIVKYAMPSTRVYLTLEEGESTARFIFKNISREPLNVPGEELLERFTRGDSSRSTEGSGLGLSIANSLTELQGGHLTLLVDGDLFKVTLDFPRA